MNMLFLRSLGHVMKIELTSVCVRGNIEKVGLPWITRSVFSLPLYFDKCTCKQTYA